MNENQRIIQHRFHPLWISDEVRAQIATIKLQSLNHFERGFHGFGFLDGDHAILTYFIHRPSDNRSDCRVPICGNSSNLSNHIALDFLGQAANFLSGALDGLVDTAFDGHRVAASRNCLYTFAENCLRQNGGGSGAIAGNIRCLRSHFTNHLGAHILERVLEFNLFCDRNTVFGDGR